MPDPIDEYLDQIMAHASLAPRDHHRVRAELKDHLAELIAKASKHPSSHKEITAMLENEFGKPDVIGKEIAAAKRPLRSRLTSLKKGLPLALAACLVLALSIRWAVAEPFYVPGKGAEPLIPQGSRILVYKLASDFRPGDVIAFHTPRGPILLGIVKANNGGVFTVSRNGEADREISHAQVIGRVLANTR